VRQGLSLSPIKVHAASCWHTQVLRPRKLSSPFSCSKFKDINMQGSEYKTATQWTITKRKTSCFLLLTSWYKTSLGEKRTGLSLHHLVVATPNLASSRLLYLILNTAALDPKAAYLQRLGEIIFPSPVASQSLQYEENSLLEVLTMHSTRDDQSHSNRSIFSLPVLTVRYLPLHEGLVSLNDLCRVLETLERLTWWKSNW